MFKNKVFWILLALAVFVLALPACQPEEVEVTRIVEIAGEIQEKIVTEFQEVEVEVTLSANREACSESC